MSMLLSMHSCPAKIIHCTMCTFLCIESHAVTGLTGEQVLVLKSPDLTLLRSQLQEVLSKGITSLAVVFLHSYTFGEHEQAVGRLALELGFAHVSLSSEVRTYSAVV